MAVEVVFPSGGRDVVPVESFVLDPYSRLGSVRAWDWPRCRWCLVPVKAWRVLP
jgi:hypothetical protein